jgi:hypothetical protein
MDLVSVGEDIFPIPARTQIGSRTAVILPTQTKAAIILTPIQTRRITIIITTTITTKTIINLIIPTIMRTADTLLIPTTILPAVRQRPAVAEHRLAVVEGSVVVGVERAAVEEVEAVVEEEIDLSINQIDLP